jgi:hypothetical protein
MTIKEHLEIEKNRIGLKNSYLFDVDWRTYNLMKIPKECVEHKFYHINCEACNFVLKRFLEHNKYELS